MTNGMRGPQTPWCPRINGQTHKMAACPGEGIGLEGRWRRPEPPSMLFLDCSNFRTESPRKASSETREPLKG